ncbi:MAG: hypothetical protein Q7S42_05165 [Candidatus Omnitrophota bacterium]|nr:hypothetical protein [Candidatus Omnitrophota bacterium]
MKVSLGRKIRPAVLSLSDIEYLCTVIIKLSDEENKKASYKRNPDFELVHNNGRAYQFDNTEEFVEQIKIDLLNIKKLKLSYWGEEVRLSLRQI